MIKLLWAFVDFLAVVIFVEVGRSVHGHTDSIAGLASTAYPFLVGLFLGWVSIRAWRRPTGIFPVGVTVWLSTVVIGQILRLLVGQGSAVPFVLVSLGYFALTMIGWRLAVKVVLPIIK